MTDKKELSAEEMTVRKFMLKKFPTHKYMDCPVPKEYWDIIQEYANKFASQRERMAFETGFKSGMANQELHPDDDSYDKITMKKDYEQYKNNNTL